MIYRCDRDACAMQEEHDLPARILRALRFRPKGMTITEVAKQLGVTRNSVSKHLEILQIAGKVDVRQIGNAKLYSLAQRVPISAFLCFTKNLILILDADQRIVQVNDQCLKHLRQSKEDLIGRTIQEAALPVVSTPEALAVIDELEREQVIADIRYAREDGEFFYQMQAIPTTFEDGDKGCTLVLEDITERKRYVRNMEFLARTAMELVDMPPEADIYQYIAETIVKVVPNPRCYVHSYDEAKQEFFIRAMTPDSIRNKVKEIIGEDPVGMVFPVRGVFYAAPFNESSSTFFAMREMHFRPYFEDEQLSFEDACLHVFPEDTYERLQQRFEVAKIYLTGLVWQEQLFGLVGICMGPDEVLEDKHAIESFLRQASIALARRQTEERLRRSEARFRDLIDSSPVPSAVIESGGRYAYINRAFTDLFGYTLEDIPTGKDWFRLAFPDETQRREAIAVWKADREQAGPGRPRPRTFSVRCRDGEEKAIRFSPVELSDGTEYVTYEDVTEERRVYGTLLGEIAQLRKK